MFSSRKYSKDFTTFVSPSLPREFIRKILSVLLYPIHKQQVLPEIYHLELVDVFYLIRLFKIIVRQLNRKAKHITYGIIIIKKRK